MGWLQNSLGLDLTGEWSQIVHINVGGVAYTCLRKTFLKYQDNPVFAAVLQGSGRRSDDGSAVIDRDGMIFRHVLNFMRLGRLVLPDHFDEWELLLDDAKYYQLKDLEDAIKATYEFQQRAFRKTLPQAVVLSWTKETNAASITPSVPALQANPSGSGLLYQGKYPMNTIDSTVGTLLSVYGYAVQHWRSETSSGRDVVFLSLSPSQH